jgi:tRNA1Val (adenine37-N6)-methyltransferase
MSHNSDTFHFKNFSLKHDRCAMKIGTDGVLLAAWTHIHSDTRKILDVGSGTGVISLMMAQRCPSAEIDGVELDPDAYEQCIENFEQSPWKLNLFNYHCSFQEFTDEIEEQYDLIISNPPYFDHGDRPESSRKLARDAASLPLESLIIGTQKLLAKNGRLALVLPAEQEYNLLAVLERYNFTIMRLTRVRGRAERPVKRILAECAKITKNTSTRSIQNNELIIEHQRHIYTREYQELVKEFYLKM